MSTVSTGQRRSWASTMAASKSCGGRHWLVRRAPNFWKQGEMVLHELGLLREGLLQRRVG